MKRAFFSLLLLVPAATALAELLSLMPGSPAVEAILYRPGTPAGLRANLIHFATTDTSRDAAGEAWYWTGLSFDREGAIDSARVCYERALELRGAAEERDAFSETLFARGRPADLVRAREVLAPRLQTARITSEIEVAAAQGRIAWSFYLAGLPDSAARMFERYQRRLLDDHEPMRREWRYRMAAAELGRGGFVRAYQLLTPLAVMSRLQDRDVMEMVRAATDGLGASTAKVIPALQHELARADEQEDAELAALGGARVAFAGTDGFPLSGYVIAPTSKRPRRAAVALLAPGERFADYDSLAAGLSQAGFSTILVELRGSGRSVASAVPLPDSWRTREAEMQWRCARDVAFALSALARSAPVDTSAFLLVASGAAAPIAAEAATEDPRARVLLLISPAPSPVDRGMTRALIAGLRRPIFLQTAAEEFMAIPFADTLYHSIDQRVSRISDTERMGRGARAFRHDPAVLPRLTRWLTETWTTATRAPRPSAPRRG